MNTKVNLFWAVLLWLLFNQVLLTAQSSGDYRTNVNTSGNWNASGSWQKYNGSTWAAASDYPGQNTGTGTVTIRDVDDITLNVSPANAIGALVVGEGASGTLQTSNADFTLNVTNGLTVKAGASFNLRRLTLGIGGSTLIDGTITDNHDNGSASFTGSFTIGSAGSVSTTNASAFTFLSALTNNGTFSLTGSGVITFRNGITNNNSFNLAAVTFSNNNQFIGGSSTTTISGIVTVTTIILTNNSTDLNLTNTGANSLTGTGTWRQGTNSVLNFSGTSINISTIDFNTNANTVDYTRAGTQTISSATYRNLSVSTSGTKTLAGAVTINGNLDISGSAILASDLYQITGNASGTLTMASGTTLTLGNTGNAANILFPTNFTNANITINSASTVTYQNNSTQTVSVTPNYGNLTIATGGTKSISGNVTIGGNLTISAGTFDLGTTSTTLSIPGTATVTGTLSFNGTITKTVSITGNLSGAGTINMSGGSLLHNLNLGGANNAITTFTTVAVASTVNYTRAGAQQVFGSANYRNLTTSGSGTKSMQGAVTVANTFTIGSGTTFDPVGNSITVSGSSVFAGTLAESNTGGTNSFQNIDLSGGTINGTVTDVTNVNGNLTMPTGNGTIGRTTLTVTGTTTVADGRSLTINSNTGVKTFVGAVTINGTGTWTSTTVSTTGNLIFRGGIANNNSNAGSFDAGGATFNTNSRTISGAGPIDFTNAVTITGAITITNQNTAGVTFNNTVNGSAAGSTWLNDVNSIAYYQPATATQPMNTGALNVSATGNFFYYSSGTAQTIKAPATSYYHLYLTGGSSATKTLQGATIVSGDFYLGASTIFNPAALNFTVSGISTIAGTFADANATGTSSLQDVDLSGGTIDHASILGVLNINGNLTMLTGNGTIGRITSIVSGTTTVATSRTLTLNNDAGVKRFDSGITVNGTGTWTSTAVTTATNLNIRGGIDVTSSSGSFAAGAATFSTNNQNIAGAGPVTFANAVSVSGAITVTNTNTSGVIFNSTVDGTAGGSTYKHGSNGVSYYQPGAATQPMNTGALDVSASGNTFYYSRSGDQNIKAPLTNYYNLVINGGGASTKTLQATTSVSNSLQVASSTTLQTAANGFTVTDASTIDGIFNDNNSTGTNMFTGLVTVNGTFSTSFNSPFIFQGGITNNGTFNQSGTGAVSFNTNNQDISGTNAIAFSGNVTLGAGITVTYKNTSAGGTTFYGTLDGSNATSKWKNDINSIVYYAPNSATSPMNTGLLDVSATNNIFVYSGPGDQTVKTPLTNYYNLVFSGGAGTKTMGSPAIVSGNFNIASDVILDVNAAQNYSITVDGNWSNSGTFLARNGTVTLNGTVDQEITSNGSSFYNLVIDNSAAQVSLNDNLTVSNVLTLNDGTITTGTMSRVIISSTAASALAGYSSTSFVNGNLRRNIASNTETYAFPVGNGTETTNYFRADIINNNLTGIGYIDSKFKPLTGHDDAEMNAYDAWYYGAVAYASINNEGVWELEPDFVPSGGSYDIKLYIANMNGLTDNNFGPLKRPVGSITGAAWITGDGVLNNDDTPGRTVASGYAYRSGLTTFSEHGVGEGSAGGSGLPIELIVFSAVPENNMVMLNWITATETNNNFFTIERSKDGIAFEIFGNYDAAGNSSVKQEYSTIDDAPLKGISYYRLKQTDLDGNFTYSDVVSVGMDFHESSFAVYPNPVVGRTITVSTPSDICKSGCNLKLRNMGGDNVAISRAEISDNQYLLISLPDNLRPGMYIVALKDKRKTHTQKIMVR